MNIFLGPPGTGKTTRLLQVVEDELATGVHPKEIAFVAFTRKAAHEAKNRAMKKFGLSEEDLTYFRTLHSLAFNLLGISKDEVLGDQDYQEIGSAVGMVFGQLYDEESEMPTGAGDKKGNNCAYLDQIARLTEQELKAVCVRYGLERYWDVKLYRDTLASYKSSRNKVDFTDMLERFVVEASVPRFRVLIVDEAQDLTPLQWRMVEMLMRNSERVYVAGDDDQAIYEWAGADVKKFLSLKGNFAVLPQSYRLPRNVFAKALSVLVRVRKRYSKDWKPREEDGAVHYYNTADQIDYGQGTWLMLCRNRYTLNVLCTVTKRLGYPYVMFDKSSVDNDYVKALMGWETLRKGEAIGVDVARLVCRKLREGAMPKDKRKLASLGMEQTVIMKDLVELGLTTQEDWMTAIHMPDSSREYYRAIRRHGESLTKWPRIAISTIHQAKGGEADHVVVSPDISEACYQGMKNDPDIEGRVFYVAVTRAIKSLHILQPRTNKYYELRGNYV